MRTPAAATASFPWRRLEPTLVLLVALHSYGIGLVLLLAPGWGLQLGGFPEGGSLFFARQGGAFHLVVATGYLLEYRRHGTIGLMLLAKGMAVVFLTGVSLLQSPPWTVPISGAVDLVMGAGMAWWHRMATTQERAGR